ncbi:unnamed protein product [Periconia digitata]|uniref:NACHT domain-containing protein n=1 Tax=Periconia digitata TaxID=1303443 RepID=A0A9W4XQL9_9PLEO|nr:unnamed protein product [Periconia digitata]
MADPLSIASGVAGILTLSSAVVGAGYRFIHSVSSAPREFAELIREVAYLNSLVSQIVSFQVGRAPILDDGSMAQSIVSDCEAALDDVQQLLRIFEKKQTSTSGRVLGPISWPFKEKDITKCRERINRLCATIQNSISIESASKINSVEVKMEESLKLSTAIGRRVHSSQDMKILDWLSTSNPTRKQAATTQLHRLGTYDWFFNEPVFTDWVTISRLLWLNAPPGAGKTVLFSHIVNYLQSSIAQNSIQGVVAYHYCEFAVSDTLDHFNIVRSLLHQLVGSKTELPQEIQDLYHSSRGQLPKLAMLLDVFQKIIEKGGEPVYILIDGLDEFPDRQKLLSIVRDFEKATPLIRVLLSSRPEYDLRQELSSETSFTIESHHIERDLDIHIRAELSSIPKLRTLPTAKHEELVKTLISRANGMFRWVQCQLDVLRLYKTYDRILESVKTEDYDYVLSMLQWLTSAYRPLHISELAEAIALDPNKRTFDRDQDRLYDPEEVLDLCGSLVRLDENGTVKLAHASCKEYLLSTTLANGPASTARFSITSMGSERHIVESLLTYGLTIALHMYRLNRKLDDKEYPLLNYLRYATRVDIYRNFQALSSWFGKHFRIYGHWYDDLLQVISFVGKPALLEANYTIAFAIRLFLQSCSLALLDGFLTASSTSDLQVISECLKTSFVDWQSYWEDNRNSEALTRLYTNMLTPLSLAAYNNSTNVVHHLLEHGAGVDGIKDGEGAAPLLKAVGNGSKDTFRVLRERGANINICNSFSSHGGTVLKRAALHSADMLDIVMHEKDLQPFLVDGRGRTIAYWIHHDSVVKRNLSAHPHYLTKLDRPEFRTIDLRIVYQNILKLLDSVSATSPIRHDWARDELSNQLFSCGPSYYEFGAIFGESALIRGDIFEQTHNCDACVTNREAGMIGKRYRCLDCIDTDLCETCYKTWQLDKGDLSFCPGHTYHEIPRPCWYNFKEGVVAEDGKTLPQVIEYLKAEFSKLLQELTGDSKNDMQNLASR